MTISRREPAMSFIAYLICSTVIVGLILSPLPLSGKIIGSFSLILLTLFVQGALARRAGILQRSPSPIATTITGSLIGIVTVLFAYALISNTMFTPVSTSMPLAFVTLASSTLYLIVGLLGVIVFFNQVAPQHLLLAICLSALLWCLPYLLIGGGLTSLITPVLFWIMCAAEYHVTKSIQLPITSIIAGSLFLLILPIQIAL